MDTQIAARTDESTRIREQILGCLRTVGSIDLFSLYCAVGDSLESSSLFAVACELSNLVREGAVALETRAYVLRNGQKTWIAMAGLPTGRGR